MSGDLRLNFIMGLATIRLFKSPTRLYSTTLYSAHRGGDGGGGNLLSESHNKLFGCLGLTDSTNATEYQT